MEKITKPRTAYLLIGKVANWLIFTLANLLIFAACSKNNNDEPTPTENKTQTPEHLNSWKPRPLIDVTQPYMTFLTTSTNTLSLTLTPAVTATTVWVDTNNNGLFDQGTDVKVTEPTQVLTFTASHKVFTIYGEVKKLIAKGNSLTAADVRNNPALTKLNVANNQLTADALTNLVASLHTAPRKKVM